MVSIGPNSWSLGRLGVVILFGVGRQVSLWRAAEHPQ